MIWGQRFASSTLKYMHKPFLANDYKLYAAVLFLSSFFLILPQTQFLGYRILTQIFKFHFSYSHCSVIKLDRMIPLWPHKAQPTTGESIFLPLHFLRHHERILYKKPIATSSLTMPAVPGTVWAVRLGSKMPALVPWHLAHLYSLVGIHGTVLNCAPKLHRSLDLYLKAA